MPHSRPAAGSPLVAHALALAAFGWGVFLLRPGGKLPIAKSNGFKDATTDAVAIREAWRGEPNANIGVATGGAERLFVLDVDVHGKVNGIETLDRLEREHGKLPPTVQQRTPTGGAHYFFRYDGPAIGNSAGRAGPGLDGRGDGGYIVAPPSMHPNGKPYAWVDGADPWSRGVAPLPAWLEVLVRPPPKAKPPPVPSRSLDGGQSRYVEAAFGRIITELSRATEGNRNHALNTAAFALGCFVGAGARSAGRCEAALSAAAASLGLPSREIAATIASGMKSGAATLREIPPPAAPRGAGGRSNPAPRSGGASHEPDAPAAALPFVAFASIEASLDANDFVESLLTSCGMSVLYGETNSGKTFFALNLALCIALGRSWFNRACDVGAVVYVAAEGGNGARNRIAAFRAEHGLEDATVPFALIASQINMLDPAADTPRLVAAIERAAVMFECPVRLVVVDTLSRALFGGNENAPEDMGALVANADAVRQATGAHVLFVHHRGKDEARGMRGHSLLVAAIDTEIEIERDGVTKLATARVKKQRDLASEGSFPFRLKVVDLGVNGRGKPVTSCVVIEAEEPKAPANAAKLDKKEAFALEQLREMILNHGSDGIVPEPRMSALRAVKRWAVREWFIARGVVDADEPKNLTGTERSRISRLLEGLRMKGRIGKYGEWVWLITG